MKNLLLVLGALTLTFILLVGGILIWFFVSLPDVQKLKGCFTTQMYKVWLCDTSPDFVTLDKVSPALVGAIIMSEDAAFFTHDGLDVNEMKESLVKNITVGHYARGGSTITQQLVKNAFLSPEKSILRKLQEIYLAIQVEKSFTKKRILTLYINVVEFGPDLFGVKRASFRYFNKNPSELLPEEAAFLAFLLPNPKKYSESAKKKQLTVFAFKSITTILRKMLLGKKISEVEYQSALGRAPFLFGGQKPNSANEPAGEAGSAGEQPADDGEIEDPQPQDFLYEGDEF